jgi:hypothetical protein
MARLPMRRAGTADHAAAGEGSGDGACNPLRGITADSAYIAAVRADRRAGRRRRPLVRRRSDHECRDRCEKRRRPVYIAAFAPEEGETLGAAQAGSKDSVLNSALVPAQYPTADGGSGTEFSIEPAKARDAFAGDLSDQQAALIGATQRPVAELAFSEPSGPPAWKDRPSWAVVATLDRAAGTDVTRSMAERAGAAITEVPGSHVIMVSEPVVVADVIMEAVAAV